jgi:hypothetical protein
LGPIPSELFFSSICFISLQPRYKGSLV